MWSGSTRASLRRSLALPSEAFSRYHGGMLLADAATPLAVSALAGASTLIGAVFPLIFRKLGNRVLSFALGLSAGAMVYLSFMELLPYAMKHGSGMWPLVAFFAGAVCTGFIDLVIPHHASGPCPCIDSADRKLAVTGSVVAIAIALHNIPEGVAVFMGALGNWKFGTILAVATALHNIPEGIAVAAPVYRATGSRKTALWYAAIAGFAEPIGAIAAYLLLLPHLSPVFLTYVFAAVAGIMVYVSFDELLPTCFEYATGHIAIGGILTGIAFVAVSLAML